MSEKGLLRALRELKPTEFDDQTKKLQKQIDLLTDPERVLIEFMTMAVRSTLEDLHCADKISDAEMGPLKDDIRLQIALSFIHVKEMGCTVTLNETCERALKKVLKRREFRKIIIPSETGKTPTKPRTSAS